MSKPPKKPVILVSSTVYGIEELLDRIYAVLTAFGYEVGMSHKGTLAVRSDRTAFENCLNAVEKCDLFLGIITPNYGSSINGDDLSITHQELRRAVEINKPRWLLAHDHVIYARNLLRDFGYRTPETRSKLKLGKSAKSITDLRVIDMYEEALAKRDGNWVQKFNTDEDALLFATAQFSRYQEVEQFIQENLASPAHVQQQVDQHRGGQA